jgi:hypothetical protein
VNLVCAATTDKSLVTLKDREDRQIMKFSRCHRDRRSLDIFISYLRFNVTEWWGGEGEQKNWLHSRNSIPWTMTVQKQKTFYLCGYTSSVMDRYEAVNVRSSLSNSCYAPSLSSLRLAAFLTLKISLMEIFWFIHKYWLKRYSFYKNLQLFQDSFL